MNRTINWFVIRWRAIDLDRKIELFLVFGGIVIASIVMINGGVQLEQMREQTRAMQGQVAEMKTGGADTKIIAESTRMQAEDTHRLALATQESLELAREQAAMGMRPYISVSKVDVGQFNVGNRPIVNLHYVNFGVSPAVSITTPKKMVIGKLATEIAFGQLSEKKIDQDILKN